MTKHCSALDVVEFLNNLYTVMDKRMDEFDVYKVETISDSYLVASGLPKTNGDKYQKHLTLFILVIGLFNYECDSDIRLRFATWPWTFLLLAL